MLYLFSGGTVSRSAIQFHLSILSNDLPMCYPHLFFGMKDGWQL